MVDDGEAIATVGTYNELLQAIVARRRELGLSQLAVDDIAGLQTGYTGKLECGSKRLGAMSMEALLGAVGLELVVVRIMPHHERQGRVSPNSSCGSARRIEHHKGAPHAQKLLKAS